MLFLIPGCGIQHLQPQGCGIQLPQPKCDIDYDAKSKYLKITSLEQEIDKFIQSSGLHQNIPTHQMQICKRKQGGW